MRHKPRHRKPDPLRTLIAMALLLRAAATQHHEFVCLRLQNPRNPSARRRLTFSCGVAAEPCLCSGCLLASALGPVPEREALLEGQVGGGSD